MLTLLSAADPAKYLANPPKGEVEVYLIVAVVVFFLATVWASWNRSPWEALVSVGLAFLALSLLTPF